MRNNNGRKKNFLFIAVYFPNRKLFYNKYYLQMSSVKLLYSLIKDIENILKRKYVADLNTSTMNFF